MIFRPYLSVHLPVIGEAINCANAKAATIFPTTVPLMDNSFISDGRTGMTRPMPTKVMNILLRTNANAIFCDFEFINIPFRVNSIDFLQDAYISRFGEES